MSMPLEYDHLNPPDASTEPPSFTHDRATALRDIQDGLWLEGLKITLIEGTEVALEVTEIATGLVAVVPRPLADLIDRWENDLCASLAPTTRVQKYAARKINNRLDREYGKPLEPGETYDAFAEPKPKTKRTNNLF